jgi:hypothetical protein
MSFHQIPLEGCANLFSAINDDASGLCALGQALQAGDVERMDDAQTFLVDLGRLLETVGCAILDTSYSGQEGARKSLKDQPAK